MCLYPGYLVMGRGGEDGGFLIIPSDKEMPEYMFNIFV